MSRQPHKQWLAETTRKICDFSPLCRSPAMDNGDHIFVHSVYTPCNACSLKEAAIIKQESSNIVNKNTNSGHQPRVVLRVMIGLLHSCSTHLSTKWSNMKTFTSCITIHCGLSYLSQVGVWPKSICWCWRNFALKIMHYIYMNRQMVRRERTYMPPPTPTHVGF